MTEKEKDLGNLIDVNSLPTDDLLANTIFKNSENMDTPFVMKDDLDKNIKINTEYNPKPSPQTNVNLTIENAEDIEKEFEGVPIKTKNKVRKQISNEKASTQLRKFRELFGIKRIDIKHHVVVRKDSNGNNINMTFGFRALNYEDYQWLIEKAANIDNLESTPTIDVSKYRLALIAISLCTLDDGVIDENTQGTPIWQVFGINPNNKESVRDPYFPHISIRHEAAELMLQEIETTLFHVVNELFDAYGELIDNDLSSFMGQEEGEESIPLDLKNSDS